jgi:hypothetical protein
MPKVDPKENALSIRGDIRAKDKAEKETVFRSFDTSKSILGGARGSNTNIKSKTDRPVRPKKLSLQEQMLADALQSQCDIEVDPNPNSNPNPNPNDEPSSSSSAQLLHLESSKPPLTTSNLSNIVKKIPAPLNASKTFSLDNVDVESSSEPFVGDGVGGIEELD